MNRMSKTVGIVIAMEQNAGNTFMVIGKRFINIDNLSINLIDTINPFQRGYEILSKSVTAPVLKVVQNVIEESKIDMDAIYHGERYWLNDEDEAVLKKTNSEFEQISPLEQLFHCYFGPVDLDKEGEWLTAMQIMNGWIWVPFGSISLLSSSTALCTFFNTREGFSPRNICTMPSTPSE